MRNEGAKGCRSQEADADRMLSGRTMRSSSEERAGGQENSPVFITRPLRT